MGFGASFRGYRPPDPQTRAPETPENQKEKRRTQPPSPDSMRNSPWRRRCPKNPRSISLGETGSERAGFGVESVEV